LLTTGIADARLLEDLQKLDPPENHVELCSLASSLRNSTLPEALNQKHLRSGATVSPWSELRHYIGRLGSWSRASKVLLRAAKLFPNLLHDFHVEYLESPPPIAAPSADEKTNLDNALGRMIPKSETQRLQDVREAVKTFTVMDISADFIATYKDGTFKPRIHAELLLLEHFYHRNLEFINNDRYIGCSKPSCYCCDLYMKCHPGGFVTRACHGNLWINWRAPIPPIDDDEQARKHTAKMLNEMVKTVRRDAIGQLLSKKPRRRRVPDSTTGMSTSIPELTSLFANLNPVGNNGISNHLLDSAN
jgi:OTT_1508-like deaminase